MTGAEDRGPAGGADSLRGVARGGSVNLLGSVASGVAQFLLTLLVLRTLTQDAAGLFLSTMALFMLAAGIGQLGTNTGLVYFLPRLRAHGRLGESRHVMRLAIIPVLVLAVATSVVVVLLAPSVAGLLGLGEDDRAVTYIRSLGAFLPFAGLLNVALSGTRGLGTMRPNAAVDLIARPVLQLLLVGTCVLLALGDVGLWWGLGYVPTAVLAWLWWRRLAPTAVHDGPPEVGWRSFWSYTTPRALTGVVQAATQRLDIVLVASLAGPGAAAVYGGASRFVVAGQMIGNAITLAGQPLVAESLARREDHVVDRVFQLSTAWLMAMTWPLYLVLAVHGGTVMGVFGSQYDSGGTALLVLALAMLFGTGCGMVDALLAMAGRTTWNLWNATASLIVQVGVDIWLIPRLGVTGAAIGWAAAIVVRNGLALVQVRHHLGLDPLGAATIRAGGLALVTFGAVPLASRLLLGETWTSLFVGLVVGGGLYAAGLWRWRRVLELAVLLQSRRRAPGGAAADPADLTAGG